MLFIIFLEQENELPDERTQFMITTGYLIWHFYLMLLAINDLNSKLQGKNKLFPNLVHLSVRKSEFELISSFESRFHALLLKKITCPHL